jgi:hypothetical protein
MNRGCANPSYKSVSYWGCSIASAYAVQALKKKDFGNLQNIMMPWHCLLCDKSCQPNSSPGKKLDKLAARINERLGSAGSHQCKVGTTPSWLNLLSKRHLIDRDYKKRQGRSSEFMSSSIKDEVMTNPLEGLDLYLDENELAGVVSFDMRGV